MLICCHQNCARREAAALAAAISLGTGRKVCWDPDSDYCLYAYGAEFISSPYSWISVRLVEKGDWLEILCTILLCVYNQHPPYHSEFILSYIRIKLSMNEREGTHIW